MILSYLRSDCNGGPEAVARRRAGRGWRIEDGRKEAGKREDEDGGLRMEDGTEGDGRVWGLERGRVRNADAS